MTNVKSAVALANKSHLWPRSEIPYQIDNTVSQEMIGYINWAIAHVNQTELKLRPRTAADNDYANFNASGCPLPIA